MLKYYPRQTLYVIDLSLYYDRLRKIEQKSWRCNYPLCLIAFCFFVHPIFLFSKESSSSTRKTTSLTKVYPFSKETVSNIVSVFLFYCCYVGVIFLPTVFRLIYKWTPYQRRYFICNMVQTRSLFCSYKDGVS